MKHYKNVQYPLLNNIMSIAAKNTFTSNGINFLFIQFLYCIYLILFTFMESRILLLICLLFSSVYGQTSYSFLTPYEINSQNTECMHIFRYSADLSFVVCGTSRTTKILKYNAVTSKYDTFQEIGVVLSHEIGLMFSDDALMFGFLRNSYILSIYYRSDVSQRFSRILHETNVYQFSLSQNYQYLVRTYNTTNTTISIFNKTDENFTIYRTLNNSFVGGRASISNDGNILVGHNKYKKFNLVYKNSSNQVYNQQISKIYTTTYFHYGAFFKDSSITYLAGWTSSNHMMIYYFNSTNFQLSQMGLAGIGRASSLAAFVKFSADGKYLFLNYPDYLVYGKIQNYHFTMKKYIRLYNLYDIDLVYAPNKQKQYLTLAVQYSSNYNKRYSNLLSRNLTLNYCDSKQGTIGTNSDGSCQCGLFYTWNQQSQKCTPIDCGQISHSTGELDQNNLCLCNIGYHWIKQVKGCQVINCSEKNYTTGEVDLFGACICQTGFLWIETMKNCIYSKCMVDFGSTGILLSNDQCECKYYHYWNKNLERCLPHCNRPLSNGISEDNIYECKCRGTATWNQTMQECYLNCLQIPSSTGQHESPEICTCKTYAEWNQYSLTCELDCSLIHGASEINSTGNGCLCIDEYVWDQKHMKCLRNCKDEVAWNGIYNGDGSCGCIEGSVWNYALGICETLNCDIIQFAESFAEDNTTCICESNFAWNSSQKRCILQCADLQDNLGLQTNLNIHSCACVETAIWDITAMRCVRICKTIEFSTGINVNPEECQCVIGYQWNSQGFCETTCGDKIGQSEEYDGTQHHCVCSQGYYWSELQSACYLDCLNVTNAYSYDGPTPSSCQCYPQYGWNSHNRQCLLSCDGFFDVSRSQDGLRCVCEQNAIWSERAKSCVVSCAKDSLSTKKYIYDRCECKANSQWNELQNQCQCIQGYYQQEGEGYCMEQRIASTTVALISIVGTAGVSGVMMFGWTKVKRSPKQLKRKDQNDSEQVKVESEIIPSSTTSNVDMMKNQVI